MTSNANNFTEGEIESFHFMLNHNTYVNKLMLLVAVVVPFKNVLSFCVYIHEKKIE